MSTGTYPDVPALQEERNGRWTRATTALNAGGITVNEFCAEVGLEDKGPAGEYYLRSMAIVEVPAKTGRKPDVEPVEPEPVEEVEPIEEEPEDEEEMPQDEEKKSYGSFIIRMISQETNEVEDTLEKYVVTLDELQDRYRMAFKVKPTPDEIRRKHERIITADMKSYFSDELSRIKKAIGKKGLSDIADAFWEHEDDILWKLLLKRLLASTLSGAMIALDGLMEMGVGVEWALVNQAAIAWASKYSYQLVKQINDTSQKFLQSAIPEWINSGAPLDVLIEQLAPTFGEVRASMIGVTEVTGRMRKGNYDYLERIGSCLWKSMDDGGR